MQVSTLTAFIFQTSCSIALSKSQNHLLNMLVNSGGGGGYNYYYDCISLTKFVRKRLRRVLTIVRAGVAKIP